MTMVGYIANNKGLLEFDGVAWNTYPIRNAKTRALEIGSDNRIYIGGMGQWLFLSKSFRWFGLHMLVRQFAVDGICRDNLEYSVG